MNYPKVTRITSYVFVLFIALIVISCNNSKQETVAVIDGHRIPGTYFLWTQNNVDFRGMSQTDQVQTLEKFYHIMLRSYAAQHTDFPGKELVQWKIYAQKRYALMETLYNHEAIDPVITDEMIHNAYNGMRERRKIRHILISDINSINLVSKRTPEEALALAKEVKRKIQSGEMSFEEASRKYSDSVRSDNGGELGFVNWGEMVEAFEEAAWSLPLNKLSDPVETQYGYHIIQVTAIDTLNTGTFQAEKADVRNQLIQRYRSKISDLAQESLKKIRNEMNYVSHDSTALRISAEMHNLYQQALSDSAGKPDLVQLLSQLEYHPVGSIAGEPISREEFAEFLGADQGYGFQGLPHANSLANQMRSYFEQETFLRYARKIHLDETRINRFKMRSAEDMNYSEAYLNNVVLANFPPGEDSLRSYYEQNKLDKYTDSLKVHMSEIYVTSKEQAQQLRQQLDNGADFAQLATQYTERPSTQQTGGDLGWFSHTRYGPIGRAALEMHPGEIRGPLQVGQGWSIILLHEKTPVNLKPYDDVKTQVRRDYILQYRTQLIDQNIHQLEEKYNSTLNYDFLDTI